MWPDLSSLVSSTLGPQAARHFQQVRQSVTQGVLSHLGPLRRLLPPAVPRPPDPAMSLAHPQRHLPPAPTAQAAPPQKAHQAPAHHTPAHLAPPPAQAAHTCPKARRQAPAPHPHHAPVPLPPQPKTPYVIFTAHDTADGLKTGLRRTFMFFKGVHDQANDMVDPIKIYQAAHQFGKDEADIYIPDPDGHTKDGAAYADKLWHDTVESMNPMDKKSAYETGQSVTNVATVVVPAGAEVSALNKLRLAARATSVEAATLRSAAEAAAGTPGAGAARAAADAAAARAAQAQAAYRAKLPGAGARQAARQVSDKGKAALAKGRAAVAKRAAAKRLAKGQAAAAGLRGKWRAQTQGPPPRQGQPALAGVSASNGGRTTHALGKPYTQETRAPKPGAGGGAPAHASNLPEPNAPPFAQRTASEEVPKDSALRRQMLVRETAQTRANSRVLRGRKYGKPTGGCVGVARTDIKGLETKVFEGGSRYTGDKPDTTFIHGDGTVGQAQSHAEQNLAGEFDRAVKEEMAAGRLTPADLQGKNVYMNTELSTCGWCKWGKNTPYVSDGKLGVPMKLSKAYPDITFTYTSDEAPSQVLVIKNGIATIP